MKSLLTSIAVLVLFSTSFSAASEQVLACDYSCNNMESQAIIYSMGMDEGDIFSVVNTKGRYAYTYRAEKFFTPEGEMFDRVSRVNTSTIATQKLNQYLNKKAALSPIQVNIPANLPNTSQNDRATTSASIILQPQLKDHIARYLETNAAVEQKVESFLAELADILPGLSDDIAIIRVSFENGSTADFNARIRSINAQFVQEFEYIENSARFSDGSRVPTSANRIIGDWYFTDEFDAQGFAALTGLWGAQLRDAISCKPVAEFECRIEDGETVCTSIQKCE